MEDSDPDTLGAISGEQSVPSLQVRTPAEVRKLQLEDGAIGFILREIEKGEKPTPASSRAQGPVAQRLTQLWERLFVQEGILLRKYDNCTPTSSPRSWPQRNEVIQELHAGALEGHLGFDKTLGKVKERFYWPGMEQDVKAWCQTCENCATRKSGPVKNRAPLQTIKVGFPICKWWRWISWDLYWRVKPATPTF